MAFDEKVQQDVDVLVFDVRPYRLEFAENLFGTVVVTVEGNFQMANGIAGIAGVPFVNGEEGRWCGDLLDRMLCAENDGEIKVAGSEQSIVNLQISYVQFHCAILVSKVL